VLVPGRRKGGIGFKDLRRASKRERRCLRKRRPSGPLRPRVSGAETTFKKKRFGVRNVAPDGATKKGFAYKKGLALEGGAPLEGILQTNPVGGKDSCRICIACEGHGGGGKVETETAGRCSSKSLVNCFALKSWAGKTCA